ncbi:MAG TPA: M17 family peptidase N-terminal domain-containing protein [Smithella sp.]|nr:M17 family peptidase N-terminal domain-containing protein [Smithella sp.]HOG90927.1 M17 family peptidase N-terminal domain-containing protein [Smithella sp.]HOU50607.1 M17 family peptidase N-terminal domain-containing protein [Smithella sp.]HQG64780.1 M17 family peptidase N-terminal domain-containing protein [Smithella sp.]HQH16866.1 M17 family peptidase N-terminal domain-containing protein [Smithella sp.]
MQLNISTENPDLPKHKCFALGIFEDEKPPRGICGFIDWRLNGFISREIKEKRIQGELEEKIIIPFPGRIGSEMLLLVGLGKVAELNYDKIYNAAYNIAQTVDKIGLDSFAFDLHGEGRSQLVTANIMEAMITGFFDFLSTDINKLSVIDACAVAPAASFPSVFQGIRQFKTNVQDKGSVDISSLEESLGLG